MKRRRMILTIAVLLGHATSAVLAEPAPFHKGMRAAGATIGMSRDPQKGEVYVLKLHRHDWIADPVALYYGLNVGYADLDYRSRILQGGPEVGSRWFFANPSFASLYLDGSVATIFHERPLTPGSLHFNFELQVSTGALRQIRPGTFVNAGIGWHHYSNARVRGKGRNVGYDGIMVSVGFLREF